MILWYLIFVVSSYKQTPKSKSDLYNHFSFPLNFMLAIQHIIYDH